MNIIDALQALKDGKRICEKKVDNWYYKTGEDGMIRKMQDGISFGIGIVVTDIVSDLFRIYTEPLKLTAEERKALELVKACGYDLLWHDACFLWARVRGEDEAGVAEDDFPPLRALKGLFPRVTNPTSIDSLLEGTI